MRKLIKSTLIFILLLILIPIYFTSCKGINKTEHLHAKTSPSENEKLEKKTLYHCPMHPDYISDKPGECPICGMTLVPIEEEHEKMAMPEEAVKITPEKQQLIGVKFGRVEYRNIEKVIRTVAKVTYDETRTTYINTKFSGWVEELYVDYTGKLVKKGEPLFAIYSPELVSAQEEYLLALKARNYFNNKTYSEVSISANSLIESSRKKLIYMDIKEEQIRELERTGKPLKTMIFYAPFTGFVIEKDILKGKYVIPGENLYKIADIANIWILADIYEYELPFLSQGLQAVVEIPYLPGEQFTGKITYIYPYLENETRTVKLRIELPNKEFKLKPDMFGNIIIKVELGRRLTIPEEAVMDSGERKIVFIDKGKGFFEPREVKLGAKSGDFYEVLEGVEEGEKVVTSANFLIDSETKLKSALKRSHQH
ncbi:MAG: efflux RND transporter periplasmic adaptor subunit [Candidatus Aminicenantia bacterium]